MHMFGYTKLEYVFGNYQRWPVPLMMPQTSLVKGLASHTNSRMLFNVTRAFVFIYLFIQKKNNKKTR